MLKRHWKKILAIAALVLVIGAILVVATRGFGKEDETQTEEQTYTYRVKTLAIEPGLEDSFVVTGNVTVGQRSGITAERRATVQKIYAHEGDAVNEGDVLLQLYSESLDSSYLNTQLLYANAQANLSTSQAVANNQVASERLRLETAELQLSNTLAQNTLQRQQAEEALNAAKLGSDLSVAQAQTGLETAQKSYQQTKNVSDANLLAAETGLQNAIRGLRTTIFSGLNTSNELLNVSSNYRGNAGIYADLISTRSQNTKTEAENALKVAITAYESAEDTYVSMQAAATEAEHTFDTVLNALNLTTPKGELSSAVLSNYIASMSASLSGIRSGLASLESANDSLTATKRSIDATLVAAGQQVAAAKRVLDSAKQDSGGTSQAVKNAEAAYHVTLSQLKTSEDNARKAVESARLALSNAQQSANLTVLGARNATLSAQDALNQLNISRENLIVHANFSGTVADIPVKLGDEVNAGTVIATIENPETKLIEVQIAEADTARIAVGDTVTIGEGTGVITSISSSADTVTKKFDVEIMPNVSDLKIGQFVRVTFESTQLATSDSLFIPIASVIIGSNETYVWTLADGKTVKTPVVLGDIQGDSVEVLEGIVPGTEIIIEGGRIIENEGTEVEVTQ